MAGMGSMDEFATVFRQEHREIRDAILDLIEAARGDDQIEARRLVGRLGELTGPHFRYEEERLYPALVEFFGHGYVERLCTEHDTAIAAAGRLVELVDLDAASESDREWTEALARGLLPHVSDCEGLSIMVERLPEREVASILAARRRAWEENLDLLRWADEVRPRSSAAASP